MMCEWDKKYAVCNYCSNAFLQDDYLIWCEAKDYIISGKSITSGRSCKKFDFCSVSVLDINREYKPNRNKTISDGQIKFEFERGENNE